MLLRLQSARHRYAVGLLTGYAFTSTTILIGLWFTPFTLRYLDRREYALFILASDIVNWLRFLDLGTAAGLRGYVAQLSAGRNQEEINGLASTAFLAQTAIAALVLVAGGLIAVLFPVLFGVPASLRHDAVMVLAILALGTAVSTASQTFSALLVAYQQIHIDNLIRLLLIVLSTALTAILLIHGFRLLSLAIAHLIATMAAVLLAMLRCSRALPMLSLRPSHASWRACRQLLGPGIWFSLGGLAGIVVQSLDRVVAARVVSLEAVTTLTLTGRVYSLGASLLGQITETARPALGRLIGAGDRTALLSAYRRLFRLSTGFSIVAAVSMWAGNAGFVRWWVGQQHYGGGLLDVALALNLMVYSWVLPNRAALTAAMIARPPVLIRLIEAALNLALSIFLGKRFGLVGILAATTVAALLTTCWCLPRLTMQALGGREGGSVRADMVPMLAVLLPVAGTAAALRHLLASAPGWIGSAAAAGLTVMVGLPLVWIMDRSELRDHWIGRAARVRRLVTGTSPGQN